MQNGKSFFTLSPSHSRLGNVFPFIGIVNNDRETSSVTNTSAKLLILELLDFSFDQLILWKDIQFSKLLKTGR